MRLQSPQPHGCSHFGSCGFEPWLGKVESSVPGPGQKKIFAASLVAETVKSLPAMRETRVRSLGRGDPLGKRMATHSIILA